MRGGGGQPKVWSAYFASLLFSIELKYMFRVIHKIVHLVSFFRLVEIGGEEGR